MRQGAFKLFSFAGISVYVHWMWFLAAFYLVDNPIDQYSSKLWNVAEVLALFGIVLLHEFGHQFACRSVGGKTHDIVIWLLGGVALVTPPPRPKAELWSIAAGPLVNLVLVPIIAVFVSASAHLGWADTNPDLYQFAHSVWWINVGLLIFNILPIYPMDGGQILRCLLWFPFGRSNSLFIASIVGYIGAAVLVLLVVAQFLAGQTSAAIWLGIVTFFIVTRCWTGLQQARALGRVDKMPRRAGFECPSCHAKPPLGRLWRCGRCRGPFDPFESQGTCPHCGQQYSGTQCLDCGNSAPLTVWGGGDELRVVQ